LRGVAFVLWVGVCIKFALLIYSLEKSRHE
jgi:hypothetical protein